MTDQQQSSPQAVRVGRRISTAMGGDWRPGSAQLLVGHDTHPASQAAVRVTADLAARLGAYLHIVHVVGLADTPVDADSSDWDEAARDTLRSLEADAKSLLAGTSVNWTYHACNGDPVELLASIAVEYEVLFIAVGDTERNLARRLMEGGSVSKRLLRGYGKPVLVVPAPHHEVTPES